jgi:hypothetical protein
MAIKLHKNVSDYSDISFEAKLNFLEQEIRSYHNAQRSDQNFFSNEDVISRSYQCLIHVSSFLV